jgi:hypothetical protein
VVTCGRRNPKDRPHGIPFHTVPTKSEARSLIVLHCRSGYDGEYRIDKDWSGGDIAAAIASARRKFGLSESVE